MGDHSGPRPPSTWPGWLWTLAYVRALTGLRRPHSCRNAAPWAVSVRSPQGSIRDKAILPTPSPRGGHQLLQGITASALFCHLFWGGGADLTNSLCPPGSEHPKAALLTYNIPPSTHRFFSRSSFLSELEALCPPTSKGHLAPTFLLQPFLHPQSSFPPKGDKQNLFR